MSFQLPQKEKMKKQGKMIKRHFIPHFPHLTKRVWEEVDFLRRGATERERLWHTFLGTWTTVQHKNRGEGTTTQIPRLLPRFLRSRNAAFRIVCTVLYSSYNSFTSMNFEAELLLSPWAQISRISEPSMKFKAENRLWEAVRTVSRKHKCRDC